MVSSLWTCGSRYSLLLTYYPGNESASLIMSPHSACRSRSVSWRNGTFAFRYERVGSAAARCHFGQIRMTWDACHVDDDALESSETKPDRWMTELFAREVKEGGAATTIQGYRVNTGASIYDVRTEGGGG